jgi:hypothetical protein
MASPKTVCLYSIRKFCRLVYLSGRHEKLRDIAMLQIMEIRSVKIAAEDRENGANAPR